MSAAIPWVFGGISLTVQPRYGVRRNLAHRPAAIRGRDRGHPFGVELAEVLGPERAAVFTRDLHDRLRGLSLVVPVAAMRRDAPERSTEIRVAEELTRGGREIANQEGGPRIRVLRKPRSRPTPTTGGDRREREAVLRIEDRGCQQLGERQCAKALTQGVPSRDHPGHRHGIDATLGHLVEPLRPEQLDRAPGGCPATGVQTVELAGPRLIDQREQVATDTVAGRLHQTNRRVGSDCRVGGVAATFEDLQTRAGGQRLTRRDDAIGRGDHRATDDRSSRLRRVGLCRHAKCKRCDDDGRQKSERESHGHHCGHVKRSASLLQHWNTGH